MFSALIVVVPLILPLAAAFDVHPIHLGIIFLANLEIGYSTPPVGLNLFIASARFDRPILDLYRAALPFLGLLLIALLLITYIPALSLVLVTE
jgi:TRAP-type C4-dicarboxylate transport system permease large subunit